MSGRLKGVGSAKGCRVTAKGCRVALKGVGSRLKGVGSAKGCRVGYRCRVTGIGSASFELYTCSVSSTHARTLLTSSGQPAYTRAAAEQLVGVTKRGWHTWQYPMRGSIQCVAVSNARLWSYETIGVSRRAVRARYRHTRLH